MNTDSLQWSDLTPGQKAKRTYDWFVEAYRFYLNDDYDCKGGRDMGCLTRLMNNGAKNASWDEVCKRLTGYLQDTDVFLSKRGHALNHFEWNAYSQKETANREVSQRRFAGGTRADATREDIERVTRSITDPRPSDDANRHN